MEVITLKDLNEPENFAAFENFGDPGRIKYYWLIVKHYRKRCQNISNGELYNVDQLVKAINRVCGRQVVRTSGCGIPQIVDRAQKILKGNGAI